VCHAESVLEEREAMRVERLKKPRESSGDEYWPHTVPATRGQHWLRKVQTHSVKDQDNLQAVGVRAEGGGDQANDHRAKKAVVPRTLLANQRHIRGACRL